jgi:hypothetical protein
MRRGGILVLHQAETTKEVSAHTKTYYHRSEDLANAVTVIVGLLLDGKNCN